MTIFGDGDGYGYGYGYHILQACQLITWSVLESVFDGGVPDHDAAEVVLHGGRDQGLEVVGADRARRSEDDSVRRGSTSHT